MHHRARLHEQVTGILRVMGPDRGVSPSVENSGPHRR